MSHLLLPIPHDELGSTANVLDLIQYPFTDWKGTFPNTSFPEESDRIGRSFIDIPIVTGHETKLVDKEVKTTQVVVDPATGQEFEEEVVTVVQEEESVPVIVYKSVIWLEESPTMDFDPETEHLVEGKPFLGEDLKFYKNFTVEPLPKHYNIYTGNAKLDLFTEEEQLTVVTATMTDPVVKLVYDRLVNADFITYEDPSMENGLSILVAKSLLTPERKEEIVTTMTTKQVD